MIKEVFLLLLVQVVYSNDDTMAQWQQCTRNLRNGDQIQPEMVPLANVLSYCHTLRTDVAACLSHKKRLTPKQDDGSKASRGKILVNMIEETNRNKEVVQLARYYFSACVYSDIGTWIRNDSCYYAMLHDCVFQDGDCYGMKCRSEDDPATYKTSPIEEKNGTNLKSLLVFFYISIISVY